MAKNLYEDVLELETAVLKLKGDVAMFERMIEIGWIEGDVVTAFCDVRELCNDIENRIRFLRQNAVDKVNAYHAERDINALYGV